MTHTDPTETFRQEALEVLDQLEKALLDLGDALDDQDLIGTIFRALHTLKGSGAMFGFDEVAEFVHDFETAFDRVRKGEVHPSDKLVLVALAAKDHVASLIDQPGEHGGSGEPILDRLREIVATDGSEPAAKDSGLVADTHKAAPTSGWHIHFRLPEDALALGSNPLLLLDELRDLGECTVRADTTQIPMLHEIDPEVCYIAWSVTLVTEQPSSAVEDVFLFVRDGMTLNIEPLGLDGGFVDGINTAEVTEQDEPDATSVMQRVRTKKPVTTAGSTSLRVGTERLDELLDLVGELVIAQARLVQIAEADGDTNLKNVTEEIERLTAGLRDTTMGIRMVPIGTLFSRFRRLVHDLSGELDKEVELTISGEETELDKTVIERLADPLLHIIRNAIDHGLEEPDARTSTGKPRLGSVHMSATHEGAEVAVTIKDDGAGLDTERIRLKAEEAGLIAPGTTPSEQELYQFILHPGFSTAQDVSAISGRGVGMDVVSQTINALRGSIEIASQPGKGTSVTLRLPLTLAIIDGMLVSIGKSRYLIPLSAVEECVELPADAADGKKGRNFLSIRDRLVPFLRVRELFRSQAPMELHQKVVIISTGEHRVGLVVDQILGNNQTVIKSLSRLHANIETFSGATILGDGTVALILDAAHLVRLGQQFENRLRDENDGRAA